MNTEKINLDIFQRETKEILLNGKTILYKDLTAEKAFKVVEMYTTANNILIKKLKDVKSDNEIYQDVNMSKKYMDSLINIVIYIIKPDTFSKEYKWLTKKWLYKNSTVQQLSELVKTIIDPIIKPDKKKATEPET